MHVSPFPDFYIVGAPKCGTTAFYDLLRQHPQVFLPQVKELIFFGSDLSYPTRLSEEEFLSHFAAKPPAAIAGTAHTAYLQSTRAATEISLRRPDAKIFILLRNPAEMLYSWHSELLYETIEDIESFEAALDAEPDRRRGARVPPHARNSRVESLFYSEIAAFYVQVKRYVDTFGAARVHVIIQEELLRDPRRVYSDALAFLDVEASFVPEFRSVNANKAARSRLLQRAYYAAAFPGHGTMRRLLPTSVRQRLKALNTRATIRPPLAPHIRVRLEKLFEEDVAQLELLLGRALWTFGADRR